MDYKTLDFQLPQSGGAFIPSMSYFLVEYNFGSATDKGDNYTATKALEQRKDCSAKQLYGMYVFCRYIQNGRNRYQCY